MAVRDFVIERGDMRLAVRDYGGDGPDVILLHGWGANIGSWERIAPALAGEFHVVAFDQRGHGASSSAGAHVFAAWVEDLDFVIQSTSVRDPLLVGHSWGARVALAYAGSDRRCSGLVSIDGANTRIQRGEYDFEQEVARWASDPLVSFRGDPSSFEQLLERARAELSAEQWVTYEPILRRQFTAADGVVRHRRSPGEMALLNQPIQGADSPVLDFYGGVTCAVLLVNARDSQAPEKEANVADITRRHPNVTSVWIDSGHDLPTDRPDTLVNMIKRFHRELVLK